LLLLERLKGHNVVIFKGVEVKEIKNNSIVFDTTEEKSKEIRADAIILATGSMPQNELKEQVIKKKAEGVYYIGDCKEIGEIAGAIHDGSRIGRLI
jgi:thioredoxin reductase